MLIAFFVIVVLLIAVGVCVIKIVPESMVFVVERLGKFDRVIPAGVHVKLPYIERIANKVSYKEQVADFPPVSVITKDNITLTIDTVVYFKVSDPKLYTYGVFNPMFAIENLTATTLRNIVGDLELDDTLTSRDLVNEKMREILDEATDAWGIKINRVEIKNIIPPREIQDAMEKQMKAERDRRETLLEAEGHKQAIVLREQGNKEARVLEAESKRAAAIAEAEGKAKSIELVYKAEADGLKLLIDTVGAEGMLLLKKLEALEKVGDGQATKIILPTSLAECASELTVKSEVSGIADVAKRIPDFDMSKEI